MKSLLYLSLYFIAFSALSSCVSYRKYEDLQAKQNQLETDFKANKEALDAQKAENLRQLNENKSLVKDIQEAQADIAVCKERYDQLDRTNRDLMVRYDRMLEQNEKMLSSSSEEKQKLLFELNTKQRELETRAFELNQLETDIKQKEKDVEFLQNSLIEREAKVKELEGIIAENDARLKTLKAKVSEALLGFSNTDLNVREENGKVYVSLSQNLLFASGSKTINSAGKDAIAKLAAVLKTSPEINITVEGHTDTDGEADFNWDLSVMRATSVVKELTKNGVNPNQVTASGRGEFFPVASNSSTSGKAQNRRTEIILSPQLDALMNMIKNQ
ncbi:MAG TPA: OmpA family protein [Saprospiraceae bacterium]|nr:OmpA family protein [Saprospiraceae bacterium]HMQ83588.1 OmpA family protein [Saprospiraceae bacterium]